MVDCVIILRHVTNELTDTYWKKSYDSIRKIYGNGMKIVIIDDNSSYTPTKHTLENCDIINSEYPSRGELLPYYYMYKLKLGEKCIIIHDSVFLNVRLDMSTDYVFMWQFDATPNHLIDQDDNENVNRILSQFGDQSLIDYYNSKEWIGCFGAMSIITMNTIEKILGRYPNFFNVLLNNIISRRDRMSFERIISIVLIMSTGILLKNSVFGNIHQWCENITDNKKCFFLNTSDYDKDYPVIKLWNSR